VVIPDKRFLVMMQWKDWPPVAISSPMREEQARNLLVMYRTNHENLIDKYGKLEPRTHHLGEIVIVPTP
jgi:hypothetical protein